MHRNRLFKGGLSLTSDCPRLAQIETLKEHRKALQKRRKWTWTNSPGNTGWRQSLHFQTWTSNWYFSALKPHFWVEWSALCVEKLRTSQGKVRESWVSPSRNFVDSKSFWGYYKLRPKACVGTTFAGGKPRKARTVVLWASVLEHSVFAASPKGFSEQGVST